MDLERLLGPLILLLFGIVPSIVKAAKKREEAARRRQKPASPPPAPASMPPAPEARPPRKMEQAIEDFIGEFFSVEEAPPPPPPPSPPLETVPEGPEAVSRELPVEGADPLERIPDQAEGYARPFGLEGARPLERIPQLRPRFSGDAPVTRVKKRRRELRGPLAGTSLRQAILLREILGPCRALQKADTEPGRS